MKPYDLTFNSKARVADKPPVSQRVFLGMHGEGGPPRPDAAASLVQWLTGRGMQVFSACGGAAALPFVSDTLMQDPELIRVFLDLDGGRGGGELVKLAEECESRRRARAVRLD
jgi:hypothetical protein